MSWNRVSMSKAEFHLADTSSAGIANSLAVFCLSLLVFLSVLLAVV